ncbi:MAG: recombinase RecA [Bacteroidota bacterium]
MAVQKSSTSHSLSAALTSLEKQYGQGIVMKLSEGTRRDIPCSSTGSFLLDDALGIGGLPHGRIVEIYGPEASGKSTLSLHCIAEVQKQGGQALLIDTEHAFNATYAQALGVDTKSLLVSQPDYGEQALEVANQMIQSQGIQIVVIDSVAALLPKSELMGEVGHTQVGSQARLMSQALRKLTSHTYKTESICLFINQLRMKIGVPFGNPETTPGGQALRFYASVRLDIRKAALLKQGEKTIGHRAKVKVVKNKVAPPFKVATFDLIYGQGISRGGEIIDLSLPHGIIKQSGAWFTYEDHKLGQGRMAACQALEANTAFQEAILSKVKEANS